MVRWEHVYLLGMMVFRVSGDVFRDFDEHHHHAEKRPDAPMASIPSRRHVILSSV